MPVTGKWYSEGFASALGVADWLDWAGNTFKVVLLSSAYTPDDEADSGWASISAYEISAPTCYTPGGETLVDKWVITDTVNQFAFLYTNPYTWINPGIIATRYAVIYNSTDDVLIAYIDFGAEITKGINDVLTVFFGTGTAGALRLQNTADANYNFYTNGLRHVLNGDIDFSDIKFMLCTSSYAYDLAADDTTADVTNEVVGAGYVAGGKAITDPAVLLDPAATPTWGAFVDYMNSYLEWAASTITARIMVAYNNASANKELIAVYEFPANQISAGGAFQVFFPTTVIAVWGFISVVFEFSKD